MALELLKAHAYGNDFLYLEAEDLERPDGPGLAKTLCERHTGVGADGLILYRTTDAGAAMRLYNADGSFSEVSGNGVRGLAAVCCWSRVREGRAAPSSLVINTDAGDKHVSVLSSEPPRFVCRTAMGHPADVRLATIDVGGTAVEAVVLRVGNPQCVVLEQTLDESRYRRLGAALEHHPFFPEGTNVEFATGRGPGPRPHPDLGARRRADAGVRHRRVCRRRGRDDVRRRSQRRDRRLAGRHPTGGVARRRAPPDRVGRGGVGGQMDPLIRNRQQAVEAVETYSPAEQQFNQRRKTIGLFVAPLLFLLVLALPIESLTPQAHRLAAILVLVVALWVSEALPLPVSALLGPLLAIVLRVAPAPKALASFADPIIFLFIGSFILAEAMYVHGLDRRIAFTALSSRLIGRSAGRLLLVFGGVSVVLSMWISNTATAAMMFPIGLSIVSHLSTQPIAAHPRFRRFSTTLMLITAFGASIGGMATPIGTPPNLIGVGMLRELVGAPISFFRWMVIGLPISMALYAVLAAGFWLVGARGLELPEGTAALVRRELDRLGPRVPGPAQRDVRVLHHGAPLGVPRPARAGRPAGVGRSERPTRHRCRKRRRR